MELLPPNESPGYELKGEDDESTIAGGFGLSRYILDCFHVLPESGGRIFRQDCAAGGRRPSRSPVVPGDELVDAAQGWVEAIMNRNWLWAASALVGAVIVAARVAHHLISAADVGLFLLVTRGIHSLISATNGSTSLGSFITSPSAMIGGAAVLLGIVAWFIGFNQSKRARS